MATLDAEAGPTASEDSFSGAHRTPTGRRRVIAAQLLVAAFVLGLWELAVRTEFADPLLFSSPIRIVDRLVTMLSGEVIYGRTIYDHLGSTLQQIFAGYAAGAAVGITLGYLLGRSRLLMRVFEPYILALFSIPKITLAPLFILALGIGLLARVGIVFIEVFFVVFYNTLKGVVEVNEDHVNIARIMGASRYRVARRIIMPSALPSILVGLKVGVPFAMIGAILGEYIASNQGLGWLILYSSNSFDSSGTWSAILFLVATTWALGQILTAIERRVLRWQPQRRGRGMTVG